MKLKIAFLQLLPGKTIDEQRGKGELALREARDKGADIAQFPEMWSTGYTLPRDREELEKLAVGRESGFIGAFRALARELGMAVAVTFLEKHEGGPLNSVILFDRRGEEVLHYSKVHTCAFDAERVLSPGPGFRVAELDLGRGKVTVGAMICFDREFPESARILMLRGAELILAPNACPMEINRLAALRTRAYENMLAVATCNYPAGHPDCNGHSTLFDGVPWIFEEPGVRDMCVFEAGEESGVYTAELDLDLLRRHRERDVMGDRYRRPDRYALLTSPHGGPRENTGRGRSGG